MRIVSRTDGVVLCTLSLHAGGPGGVVVCDWSSGWILPCFLGCEGKIHKPKPGINQAYKEIHTATLGMKLTSVVYKLEIKINF